MVGCIILRTSFTHQEMGGTEAGRTLVLDVGSKIEVRASVRLGWVSKRVCRG